MGLCAVIGLADGVGIEGIGLHDIGTCEIIIPVYLADDIGSCDIEEVMVALEVRRPCGKVLSTIVCLSEFIPLQHGAHGAIQYEYAVFDCLSQQVCTCGHVVIRSNINWPMPV